MRQRVSCGASELEDSAITPESLPHVERTSFNVGIEKFMLQNI